MRVVFAVPPRQVWQSRWSALGEPPTDVRTVEPDRAELLLRQPALGSYYGLRWKW